MKNPLSIVASVLLVVLGATPGAAALEGLPHANNLLSKQEVERVTGLKNLVTVLREFKSGLEGDINLRRPDGVFVMSLTVQPPEFYDHWLSYHKDLAIEYTGMGDAAFGRRIPNPFEGDPATQPEVDKKFQGPPMPPELAALYVRRGDVAFTITRLPFESTAPAGMSNVQLYELADHILRNLEALTPPPAVEAPAPTAEGEAPIDEAKS